MNAKRIKRMTPKEKEFFYKKLNKFLKQEWRYDNVIQFFFLTFKPHMLVNEESSTRALEEIDVRFTNPNKIRELWKRNDSFQSRRDIYTHECNRMRRKLEINKTIDKFDKSDIEAMVEREFMNKYKSDVNKLIRSPYTILKKLEELGFIEIFASDDEVSLRIEAISERIIKEVIKWLNSSRPDRNRIIRKD